MIKTKKESFNLALILLVIATFTSSCSQIKETVKSEIKKDLNIDTDVLVASGSNKGGNIAYDFYFGKYEVTQKEFEKVMGFNPSHFIGENLPVENVTFFDAVVYCNKLSESLGLSPYYEISPIDYDGKNIVKADVTENKNSNGYRLPTSEEFKYASKGGNRSKDFLYSGSNNVDEVGWYRDNSDGKTHEVGLKKRNELGIYDLSGNVWEWQSTMHGGSYRVIRSGSFGDVASYTMYNNANSDYPHSFNKYTGFRVARTK